MIKKLFRRMLAVLLCLVLLILAAVGILFGREIATVLSTTKVTDKFSTMDYSADYNLDGFLAQGASSDSELAAFIIRNLMKGLPIEINLPQLGCSSFQAQNTEGDYIFGRNFDNYDAVYMLVHTKPATGYESISMVNLTYISGGKGGVLDKVLSLAAPYLPLDGVNEKGLAIGVMQLFTAPTAQDTGKIDITTTTAVRLVLDKAATVDEAIDLLSRYDMHSSAGTTFHFQIADANGDSATVEYIDNELVVYREADGSNLCTTNFYLSPGKYFNNGKGQDRWQTLRTGLDAADGKVTVEEGMALLHAVRADKIKPDGSFYGTLWSCIYNNTDCTLSLCCNMDYDTIYTYSVNWK